MIVLALAIATAAAAQVPGSPTGEFEDPPPAFAWQGEWTSEEVRLESRMTGASLYGVLFTPVAPGATPLPAVVIGPGSGPGVQSYYQWAARDLAGHGYVALTVDPQGVGRSDTTGPRPGNVPFQQADNYVDALASGLDFLLSDANPRHAWVDPRALGVAGHSLSARAASFLQGVDRRVRAVVAWDNLASDLSGDAGSASGGGAAGSLIGGEPPGTSVPVSPRVPSMGQASDAPGSVSRDDSPSIKKTAYERWREVGIPSMEVVLAGSAHLDWAQSPEGTGAGTEAFLRRASFYTRAWFDRWLRRDRSAVSRLLAREKDELSANFASAAFFPGIGVDCPDLRACAPPRCATVRLRVPRAAVRVRVSVTGRAPRVVRRPGRRITLRDVPRGTVTIVLRIRTPGRTRVRRVILRDCRR